MKALLSVGFNGCTINLHPSKKDLSHARYMKLSLSSGKVVNIRLDQGLGYWRLHRSANFPFDETVEGQQKWVVRKANDLLIANGKDYPTYVFKSEEPAGART